MGRTFCPALVVGLYNHYTPIAPVAQLDRASDFESAGCAFESRRGRVIRIALRECASVDPCHLGSYEMRCTRGEGVETG
jgi:hypothetical protein